MVLISVVALMMDDKFRGIPCIAKEVR